MKKGRKERLCKRKVREEKNIRKILGEVNNKFEKNARKIA
jgi:hypothetical protein